LTLVDAETCFGAILIVQAHKDENYLCHTIMTWENMARHAIKFFETTEACEAEALMVAGNKTVQHWPSCSRGGRGGLMALELLCCDKYLLMKP